jgi:hypothetical protein
MTADVATSSLSLAPPLFDSKCGIQVVTRDGMGKGVRAIRDIPHSTLIWREPSDGTLTCNYDIVPAPSSPSLISLPYNAFIDLAFDIASKPSLWNHLCGAPTSSTNTVVNSDMTNINEKNDNERNDATEIAAWRTLDQARANAFITDITPIEASSSSSSTAATTTNDIGGSSDGLRIRLSMYRSISSMNHSCQPNAVMIMGNVYALYDINNGEEVTISYLRADELDLDIDNRRRIIFDHHGFICSCHACSNSSATTSTVRTWSVDDWSKRVLALRERHIKEHSLINNK